MARVLHVEDDLRILKKVEKILQEAGHRVVGVSYVPEVDVVLGHFDLYICGPMGKYSDGLAFATDIRSRGGKVVILNHNQKFSRVPFVDTKLLREKNRALAAFERILAGD